MISGDLNQEFWLGEMPEGLEFKIIEVSAWAHRNEGIGKNSGYTTTFTGEYPGPWSSLKVHNNAATTCANNVPITMDPENPKGKACIIKSNISSEVVNGSGGIKIGTVKFRHTGLRASTSHPGVVKVTFEIIDKEARQPLARGTIKFAPTKFGEGVSGFFGLIGRPNHLPVEVNWDYGAYNTSAAGEGASLDDADIRGIGINPGLVYLVFKLAEDGETLVVTFVRKQTDLNKIAAVGVNLLLKANVQMIQYATGLRGVGMVGKAIKLGFKVRKWVKKGETKVNQFREKVDQLEQVLAPSRARMFRA
ncbi:hypothetical protein AA313_de0202218 [Arthrobotrys entomopaga]|nr:hypothetical protein AA313_de0202218 [Arthrobotrys entomopaga]